MKLPIPRGRRAILLLGVPFGLAAAGAFVFMQMSSASTPVKVPDPSAGQHGPMLALESRVINLLPNSASTYRYVKVGVTVELRPSDASFYAATGEARAKTEETEIAKHAEATPLLLDALGRVVSGHDAASLMTPDGRAKLKEELLVAMRESIGEPDLILDIYFTDLVMQ